MTNVHNIGSSDRDFTVSSLLRGGAALAAGIDHQNAQIEVDPVPAAVRGSLLGDLD